MRAIATATVSFGLVTIPVRIFSAANSTSGVRFNLLEKATGSRLKQQYVSLESGEIVPRNEMVKGYEFAKGQYVLFSDEELKALQEANTQTIEIAEFIPADSIDPIYYDKSYYLGPDKGGDRAYHLLSKALMAKERCALARYAARGKGYLVQVRAVEKGLVMQQLHYATELQPFGEVPIGNDVTKPAELELAKQIIDQARNESFQPEQYEDEVRKRMLAQIERKIEGQEIAAVPEESPRAQVIDLMEALKASLDGGSEERLPAKASGTQRTTKKKAARSRAKS
jgi:DNA end-binding protein Ku